MIRCISFFYFKFTKIMPDIPPIKEPNIKSFKSVLENSKQKLSRIENTTNEIIVNKNPTIIPVKKPFSQCFRTIKNTPKTTDKPFIIWTIIVMALSLMAKNLIKNAKTRIKTREAESASKEPFKIFSKNELFV